MSTKPKRTPADPPLTDAEQDALEALGWAPAGGGKRDGGTIYIRAQAPDGTRREATRAVWRTIIAAGTRAPGFDPSAVAPEPEPVIVQASLFDYAALDTEARIVVQQRASEIKGLMRRAAQDIIDIGQKLIDVKERLPHGQFGPWLKAEFEWSDDTARRFISVARIFGHKPQIAAFAPSALYLLAAPSTPDDVREEALNRAEAGERITHQKVKAIIVAQTPPASAALDDSDDGEPLTPYEEAALRSFVGAALGSPAVAPSVPVVSPIAQAYIDEAADYGYTVTPRSEGGYAIEITASGAVCAPAATDLALADRCAEWAHIATTKQWLNEWPTTHAPAPAPLSRLVDVYAPASVDELPAASPQRIAVEDEDGDVIIDIDTTGIDDLGAVALRAITEALRLLLRGEAHQVDTVALDGLVELLERRDGHATGTLLSVLSEISGDADALCSSQYQRRAG